MKAITLAGPEAPAAVDELPDPVPAAGELLVRVRASSVNPVDNAIAAGMLAGMVEHEFPVVLGRDFAGTVERVGDGVTRHAAGDDVFGFVLHADPTVRRGSWAELIAVAEDTVAAVPAGVGLDAAGATPLAGITALRCVEAVGSGPGTTILIVGATGGVGSFAVQLAAQAGADVIATGRADDAEYLRGLGASEVVDRDGDVAAAVLTAHPGGIDAVVDLVSYAPDAFAAYAGALAPGGRAASPLGGAGEGEGRFAIMARPAPAELARLGGLLAAGTLRVPVQAGYPLDEAPAALAALAATHTCGKVTVTVAPG